MAEYTIDKFSYGGNIYNLQDSNAAPISHIHGNIDSGGRIYASATADVASGDKIAIADTSDSGRITNGPAFGTDTAKYLCNDGTWSTPPGIAYSDFTGATTSGAGSSGLVPSPASGETAKLLWSDGYWKPINIDYQISGNNIIIRLFKQNDGGATLVNSVQIPLTTINYNTFGNIKVGTTTITADTVQDTFELVAGNNVTLTSDTTNDKVTIASTDTIQVTVTSVEPTESNFVLWIDPGGA